MLAVHCVTDQGIATISHTHEHALQPIPEPVISLSIPTTESKRMFSREPPFPVFVHLYVRHPTHITIPNTNLHDNRNNRRLPRPLRPTPKSSTSWWPSGSPRTGPSGPASAPRTRVWTWPPNGSSPAWTTPVWTIQVSWPIQLLCPAAIPVIMRLEEKRGSWKCEAEG